jgi:phospholipase/carboxylesterase
MLSRRDALKGALFALLSDACTRSKEPPPPPEPIRWPRGSVHEGVEFVELFPNDANETSPLVVAVHGRGDRPDNWIGTWSTFPAKAWIALPRAFTAWGPGYSWFDLHDGMTDAELGAAVGDAEAKLWRGVTALAKAKKRILVTGFSQGGILSFAMAARHPNEVAYAFPVAGSCPGPLLPRDGARAAPLVALHGTDDRVLDVKWGRGAVNAFKEQGNDATLKEYVGVGHAITPQMRADLWAEIVRALPLAT